VSSAIWKFILKTITKAECGSVTCNPSTQKAEAGGSQVQGQSGVHSNTLSPNKQTKSPKRTITEGKRILSKAPKDQAGLFYQL
jgi:hypothetical protein